MSKKKSKPIQKSHEKLPDWSSELDELKKQLEIEAALERVRARAMTMQHSDQLLEVIQEVFLQLNRLELSPQMCCIDILEKGSKDFNLWIATAADDYPQKVIIPYFDHPIFNEYHKAIKNRRSLYTAKFSRPIKNSFYNYAFVHSDLRTASKKRKDFLSKSKAYSTSVAITRNLSIALVNYDGLVYSKEDNEILVRFAKVFDQSYTRFLDLQKAEEQAREAQIEAALERVRSRSMGMHKSQELKEVIQIVYEQFVHLNIHIEHTGFIVDYQARDDMDIWLADQHGVPSQLTLPYFDSPYWNSFNEAKEMGIDFFANRLDFKEKNRFYKKLFKYIPSLSEETKKFYFDCPGLAVSTVLLDNIGLYIENFSGVPYSSEENDILMRFGSVFQQTYTRFLDLQKAEEQAREAQIEVSLERIRAASMAMHQSNELSMVANLLMDQLGKLGLTMDSNVLHELINDSDDLYIWAAAVGQNYAQRAHLPYIKHPFFSRLKKARKQRSPFLVSSYSKGEKDRFFNHLYKTSNLKVSKKRKEYISSRTGMCTSTALGKNTALTILNYSTSSYTEEENEIIKRFAQVFEQSYTRFLDLKKAEEQAREAQIETALERVRGKAMAMHSSDDVGEATMTLFRELENLGIETLRCGVLIIGKNKFMEVWAASAFNKNEVFNVTGKVDMTIHPLLEQLYEDWKSNKNIFTYELKGKDAEHYYSAIKNLPSYELPEVDNLPNSQISTGFLFEEGALFAFTKDYFTEEVSQIFQKFTNVFTLTYRRYLDLKQAESQAREAQIEAALERVRSAAMAMHSSNDLFKVAEVLHDQLPDLGQKELESSIIHIYPDNLPAFDAWYSYRSTDDESRQVMDRSLIPWNACYWTRKVKAHYQSKEKSYTIESRGKMLLEWYQVLEQIAPAVVDYDDNGGIIVPEVLFYHFSKFSGGALLMISNDPPTEEARDLQQRAATVFDLAYRRFLDLQKAEQQAREAQIEASLERVRAKAIGMHSTGDLTETINTIFVELKSLDIVTIRTGMGIINEENKNWDAYTTASVDNNESLQLSGTMTISGHRVLDELYEAWKGQIDYFPVLRGAELQKYYQVVQPQLEIPDIQENTVQYGYFFLFLEGGLYAWTESELSDSEIQIFKKFSSVLELTYRRYNDLKVAEARTAEAILKSSLDRVRAEIASMRKTEDLEHITPLIWKELTVLGVPFFRCGVFIIDENSQKVHMYLTKPNGEPLAALHLEFDDEDIPLVKDAIDHWKTQTVHRTHWDGQQFREFTESLKRKGLIENLKTYQQAEKPPESLNLHQVPFKQGMLYVGSANPLPDDQIELIQSLADAFSVAYSRYEDFVQLEEAKESVENTLTELQSAQNQLIHSEKMASLGELTAGIAHEIQNPLNFVNNFSEVSTELMEEMKEEIESGNLEDALEIGRDLIQNIEKINHHGQRASSIVKGMLQHSRTSTGEKEPTDINALADEYLRLAYHGFRAKDKSFNANFKTELADDLPKIEVVSQDIGRVLLNLVNNAFQAVKGVESPEVIVSTQMKDGMVEISVRDNGPGVPEDIKEKIFQPFFTTKPTGEGTGLGLSLSYDIVTKGHGGKLKMETHKGKGSEFFVELPVKNPG